MKIIKPIFFMSLAICVITIIICCFVVQLDFKSLERIPSIIIYIFIFIALVAFGAMVCFNIVLSMFVYYRKRRKKVKGEETQKELKSQIGLLQYRVRFKDYYNKIKRLKWQRNSGKRVEFHGYIERMYSINEVKSGLALSILLCIIIYAGMFLLR